MTLLDNLAAAISALAWPALVFTALALAVRGGDALNTARAAAGEVRVNLSLYLLDALLVAPGLGLILLAAANWLDARHWVLDGALWASLPLWLSFPVAIFIGDLVGYFRHRLEHSALLWPAHAIHHSDTAMTWTTLLRFHPINRLSTTLIDGTALALLGFPAEIAFANSLVRHYYGMFIHADLPWTFGPLGRVLVSPSMHRWHHARDRAGYNFATLFSVFDQAFGTYHAPGPCRAPLGAPDAMGRGVLAQLLWPFKAAMNWAARQFTPRTERKPA